MSELGGAADMYGFTDSLYGFTLDLPRKLAARETRIRQKSSQRREKARKESRMSELGTLRQSELGTFPGGWYSTERHEGAWAEYQAKAKAAEKALIAASIIKGFEMAMEEIGTYPASLWLINIELRLKNRLKKLKEEEKS